MDMIVETEQQRAGDDPGHCNGRRLNPGWLMSAFDRQLDSGSLRPDMQQQVIRSTSESRHSSKLVLNSRLCISADVASQLRQA